MLDGLICLVLFLLLMFLFLMLLFLLGLALGSLLLALVVHQFLDFLDFLLDLGLVLVLLLF